ncbi:MAG: CMGC protein kinase [Amphiamblys sp. WSBS2006]|nr:MAG: CMGC protein kinase [Amphiamblys sp. WSBS2006]
MTGNCLKHPMLLFLGAAAIVCAAEESVVDTNKTAEYKEEDYEKLYDIGSGSYGAVSKVREKKTGEIYALKTHKSSYRVYAEKEIRALQQLDHKNIVKMVTSNIESRCKDEPVHIVLEYLPCDLDAVLSHQEIRENKREILCQILEGVAHIHSKRLAHRDLKPKNILIDPANMSVKICDFGFCCKGKRKEIFLGMSMDGYRQDILSVVDLMAYFFFWESSPGGFYRGMFIKIDEVERFIKTKREGGVLLDRRLERLYSEMEGAFSKSGLGLFLKLIASDSAGAYTTAAEALEHPFFDGVRELDYAELSQGTPVRKIPPKIKICHEVDNR